MRRAPLAAVFLLCPVFSGCDDAADDALIDLDGPQGLVEGPGPWPLTLYTRPEGQAAQIQWRVDDGAEQTLTLLPARDELMVGLLPDAPPGSTVRYFARLADGRVEPAVPRSIRVLEPAVVPVTPTPCRLAFRWPVEGLRLTRFADAAPQAGVQLTAVLNTNQADGEAARLTLSNGAGPVGYSGLVGSGVVAFEAVRLGAGENTLIAEATAPGGEACRAEVRVTLEALRPDGP